MPRNRSMTFTFDDLPLIIDKGIPAGVVAGSAEIIYTDDVHDFSVGDVYLDGYVPAVYTALQRETAASLGRTLPRQILKSVPVDGALESIIRQRLEGEWAGKVEDAIREEIEAKRDYQREAAAEARYEDRRMEMGR